MPRLFLPAIVRPPQLRRVTWNPGDMGGGTALTNGNLTATMPTSGGVRATVSRNSGKRYYEVVLGATLSAATNSPAVGVASSGLAMGTSGVWYGVTTGGCGYPAPIGTHFYANNGSPIDLGLGDLAASDVMGIAIDFATGGFWLARNGTYALSGNPGTGANPLLTFTAGTTFFPCVRGAAGTSVTARFVANQWTYGAPAGFVPW